MVSWQKDCSLQLNQWYLLKFICIYSLSIACQQGSRCVLFYYVLEFDIIYFSLIFIYFSCFWLSWCLLLIEVVSIVFILDSFIIVLKPFPWKTFFWLYFLLLNCMVLMYFNKVIVGFVNHFNFIIIISRYSFLLVKS